MTSESPEGPAALLLIDYQKSFCDDDGRIARQGLSIGGLRRAAEAGGRAAARARERGVPVIWTRMGFEAGYADGGILTRKLRPNLAAIGALLKGSADFGLADGLAATEADFVIDKPRYSAVYGTPLEPLLRALGTIRIAVGGVTTSMCVETTVRDLGQRDYEVVVLADACADFDEARHEASLAALAFGFARIGTTAELDRHLFGTDF